MKWVLFDVLPCENLIRRLDSSTYWRESTYPDNAILIYTLRTAVSITFCAYRIKKDESRIVQSRAWWTAYNPGHQLQNTTTLMPSGAIHGSCSPTSSIHNDRHALTPCITASPITLTIRAVWSFGPARWSSFSLINGVPGPMAVFCLRQSALMELKSKLRHRRTSAEKRKISSYRYQHKVHARIINMYLVPY